MLDRERLLAAYERNKNKGDDDNKGKMKRDWLPIVLSLVSLLLSLTTLYFNVFFQEDDIRVVIGSTPVVSRNADGEISIFGAQQLTFINSGNRSVALTRVEAYARVLSNTEDRSCKRPTDEDTFVSVVPIPFDAKPFVVKPGEIQFISTQMEPNIAWRSERDGDTLVFLLPKAFHQSKGAKEYLVCMTLSFVVPDSYITQWQKAAYLFSFNEVDPDFAEQKALFEIGKPMVVFSHKRVRWSWW